MSHAERRKFDAVFVWKLDRFGRSQCRKGRRMFKKGGTSARPYLHDSGPVDSRVALFNNEVVFERIPREAIQSFLIGIRNSVVRVSGKVSVKQAAGQTFIACGGSSRSEENRDHS
jgi:hypothetical protein